jgi:hypothetical protein
MPVGNKKGITFQLSLFYFLPFNYISSFLLAEERERSFFFLPIRVAAEREDVRWLARPFVPRFFTFLVSIFYLF